MSGTLGLVRNYVVLRDPAARAGIVLASQALMKPMQMSVKIRTICRRYEKKGEP